MHPQLEKALVRWLGAGLLDSAAADRIRAFEVSQEKSTGLRWPVLLALAFGAILMGAGVLLFVAAHWDELSPTSRFSLVLLMTAVFHAGGALAAEKFPPLATALHAVGTLTLGAGIFLGGQIFNLAEHWPGGLMLWAAGAWVGWALLRDWPQAALAAILTPAWLAGEWAVAAERYGYHQPIVAQGLLLLALTYFSAITPTQRSATRRALVWIGGLALIPCAVSVVEPWGWYRYQQTSLPTSWLIFGMFVSIAAPLALSYALRGRAAWMNAVSALWVVGLGYFQPKGWEHREEMLFLWYWFALGGIGVTAWGVQEDRKERVRMGLLGLFIGLVAALGWNEMERLDPLLRALTYVICFLLPIGLAYWGLKVARKEFINVSVLIFAVTVLFFYFSSLMDKLGRSASLIGFGVIFLMGGWGLERLRRRLIARMQEGAS